MIRRVMERRDVLAATLIGLAFYCGAVAIASLASPRVESFLLERHQVRAGLVGHVALLPYATMYTFGHTVCMGIPETSLRGSVNHAHCERLAYTHDESGPLSCEALPNAEPFNHFPSAKLMDYAWNLRDCDAGRMDFVVRSTGWHGSVEQHVHALSTDDGFRWVVQP